MNKKELEKFRKERVEKSTKPDELREFIDTITSKTLAGELSKEVTVDLLSDLMSTNVMDKVEPQKSTQDKELEDIEDLKRLQELTKSNIQVKEEKEDTEEVTAFKDADTDFYTRSMDLSEKDFNFTTPDKEKKLSLPIKIFLFIIIVVITVVVLYLIYQFI